MQNKNEQEQLSNYDSFINLKDLCLWLRVRPATIYKYMAQNRFPKGKKPFGMLIWSRKMVVEWLDSQS